MPDLNKLSLLSMMICIYLQLSSPINVNAQKPTEADTMAFVNYNAKITSFIKHQQLDSALVYTNKGVQNSKLIFGTDNLVYSLMLNNLGTIYEAQQRDADAVKVYQDVLRILKLSYGTEDSVYTDKLVVLARVYEKMTRLDDAKNLLIEAANINKKLFGVNHQIYIITIYKLASVYVKLNNFKLAEDTYAELLVLGKRYYGDDSEIYLNQLSALLHLYLINSKHKQGVKVCEQMLVIQRKLYQNDAAKYIESLKNMALLYNEAYDFEKAISTYKEALELQKKTTGEKNLEYARLLFNQASIYQTLENYVIAEPMMKQSLNIRKEILGENHIDCIYALNNLGRIYTSMGKYELAKNYFNQAVLVFKNKIGVDDSFYPVVIQNLGGLYEAEGNYDFAEKLIKESLRAFEKLNGNESLNYAHCLNDLALVYSHSGNYLLAESTCKKTLSLYKQLLSEQSIEYANGLSLIAVLYQNFGNYSAAEIAYKQSLIIRENIFGKKSTSYADALGNLATLYLTMRDFASAEPMFINSLTIRKELLGVENPTYLIGLVNLAALYNATGKFDLEESLLKEELQTQAKISGTNNLLYFGGLNSLAGLYADQKKYEMAEKMYKEAIEILQNIKGAKYSGYWATTLHNLGFLYIDTKKYDLTESVFKESLDIIKKNYGIDYYNYATYLNDLLRLYYNTKQFEKWQMLIKSALILENKSQKEMLQNFSETEKELYVSKDLSSNIYFPSMFHYFGYKETTDFYISVNAKQGWLLKSKQKISELANLSNDTSIVSLIDNWKSTNTKYAQAMQLSIEARKSKKINLDSLSKQSQNLEKKLIGKLPAVNQSILQNGVSGKQVATKLKPGEAVIQWLSFRYKSPLNFTDSVLYSAFVITPNDTIPKFITVFEQKQLQKLMNNYHGNGERGVDLDLPNATNNDVGLYNLIWKPLLPYLTNVKTVYNLPSGLLHKVSFAALTNSNFGKQLIDEYEIHQLLTIDEFVNPFADTNISKKIDLFGGANYDEMNNQSTASSNMIAPAYRNATDQKNIKFNYLLGTEKEVEVIAENVKNTSWTQQTYNGNNATEDNLKQLSGRSAPTILHIATHGFYFPPNPILKSNLSEVNNDMPKDFPLLRSGLVLSGVNNYWGKDAVDGKEDGVVTAQEISNMNLTNTDLVTLSACETALGDIKGSEGVYGLQRAFKMAGVKNLLMSLWAVPDKETAELMSLFYGEVFKGENYYNAFRKAQLSLKAKYTDPTKWAGFVLVGQ